MEWEGIFRVLRRMTGGWVRWTTLDEAPGLVGIVLMCEAIKARRVTKKLSPGELIKRSRTMHKKFAYDGSTVRDMTERNGE